MQDARSNAQIRFKRPYKVVISIITIWSFLFNFAGYDLAWAAKTSVELPSVGSSRTGSPGLLKELNIETFELPQYLGEVKERYKGTSGNIVIHVQDAHCNYAAQHSIDKIIDQLNKNYGLDTINLEGGSGDYDLSIFTRIYDKGIREKVADDFVKEGLVNGAEYFAINNPEKATLWGVEDTNLYLENLNIYRESLRYKDEIDKHLKSLTHILNNLKTHIYSDELTEIDTKYTQYKASSVEFKEYLTYLIQKAKSKAIDIKSFTNIYLMNQSLDQEGKIDFKKANNERDQLIDRLQKLLSRNELEELVLKTLEYKTEKLSQYDFYRYIVKKAKEVNIKIEDFGDLEKYIMYVSLYSAIDKSKIMAEMDSLENHIKESLYKNDIQKELNTLSKNLALTKNIFSITLTKEDYKYYKENEDSFAVARYISFIEREAPRYNIIARPDKTIVDLDRYRENISKFYECSLKRDHAFLRNLKFTTLEGETATGKPRMAMLVTGGFHTENLCKLLKENNISYVSIMPNFRNKDEYECQYFKLLAGEMTSMEKKLYSAVSATTPQASLIAIASWLSKKMVTDGAVEINTQQKRDMLVIIFALVESGYKVEITGADKKVVQSFGDGVPVKTLSVGDLLEQVKTTPALGAQPAPTTGPAGASRFSTAGKAAPDVAGLIENIRNTTLPGGEPVLSTNSMNGIELGLLRDYMQGEDVQVKFLTILNGIFQEMREDAQPGECDAIYERIVVVMGNNLSGIQNRRERDAAVDRILTQMEILKSKLKEPAFREVFFDLCVRGSWLNGLEEITASLGVTRLDGAQAPSTVYYPGSGADIGYAFGSFDSADRIIMADIRQEWAATFEAIINYLKMRGSINRVIMPSILTGREYQSSRGFVDGLIRLGGVDVTQSAIDYFEIQFTTPDGMAKTITYHFGTDVFDADIGATPVAVLFKGFGLSNFPAEDVAAFIAKLPIGSLMDENYNAPAGFELMGFRPVIANGMRTYEKIHDYDGVRLASILNSLRQRTQLYQNILLNPAFDLTDLEQSLTGALNDYRALVNPTTGGRRFSTNGISGMILRPDRLSNFNNTVESLRGKSGITGSTAGVPAAMTNQEAGASELLNTLRHYIAVRVAKSIVAKSIKDKKAVTPEVEKQAIKDFVTVEAGKSGLRRVLNEFSRFAVNFEKGDIKHTKNNLLRYEVSLALNMMTRDERREFEVIMAEYLAWGDFAWALTEARFKIENREKEGLPKLASNLSLELTPPVLGLEQIGPEGFKARFVSLYEKVASKDNVLRYFEGKIGEDNMLKQLEAKLPGKDNESKEVKAQKALLVRELFLLEPDEMVYDSNSSFTKKDLIDEKGEKLPAPEPDVTVPKFDRIVNLRTPPGGIGGTIKSPDLIALVRAKAEAAGVMEDLDAFKKTVASGGYPIPTAYHGLLDRATKLHNENLYGDARYALVLNDERFAQVVIFTHIQDMATGALIATEPRRFSTSGISIEGTGPIVNSIRGRLEQGRRVLVMINNEPGVFSSTAAKDIEKKLNEDTAKPINVKAIRIYEGEKYINDRGIIKIEDLYQDLFGPQSSLSDVDVILFEGAYLQAAMNDLMAKKFPQRRPEETLANHYTERDIIGVNYKLIDLPGRMITENDSIRAQKNYEQYARQTYGMFDKDINQDTAFGYNYDFTEDRTTRTSTRGILTGIEVQGVQDALLSLGEKPKTEDVKTLNDAVRALIAAHATSEPGKQHEIISKIQADIANTTNFSNERDSRILETSLRSVLAAGVAGNIRPYGTDNPINVVVQFVPNIDLVNPASGGSREAERIFDREYGLNTKSIVGTKEDMQKMLERASSAMGDKEDARTFVYLPKSMETDFNTLPDALKNDTRIKVQFINDIGEYPDILTHFILGVKLLDYDRLKEKGRAPDNPEDLLNLLAAVSENPDPRAFLNDLFKKNSLMIIRKINFKDIEDWKKAQDAVLVAL